MFTRSSTSFMAKVFSLILLAGSCYSQSNLNEPAAASSVSVTILSSNLANTSTIGEWGFSALVEVDGQCILFDAGFHPDTVIRNAKALNVDLSCVTDVVLSHFHADHNGGLLPLLIYQKFYVMSII